MLELMHDYFRGERLEALAFILPAGVALVAVGAVMLRGERDAFAWSLAVPAILFGLALIGTGLGVGLRTPAQVAELVQGLASDPAQMLAAELPRMARVNANFRLMFIAFGVLVGAGLLLVYLVRSEWAHGLGIALMVGGALGLLIDGVASRRALPYTAALEQLAVQHRVDPAAPAPPR